MCGLRVALGACARGYVTGISAQEAAQLSSDRDTNPAAGRDRWADAMAELIPGLVSGTAQLVAELPPGPFLRERKIAATVEKAAVSILVDFANPLMLGRTSGEEFGRLADSYLRAEHVAHSFLNEDMSYQAFAMCVRGYAHPHHDSSRAIARLRSEREALYATWSRIRLAGGKKRGDHSLDIHEELLEPLVAAQDPEYRPVLAEGMFSWPGEELFALGMHLLCTQIGEKLARGADRTQRQRKGQMWRLPDLCRQLPMRIADEYLKQRGSRKGQKRQPLSEAALVDPQSKHVGRHDSGLRTPWWDGVLERRKAFGEQSIELAEAATALIREGTRPTRARLGGMCGISQPTVSRRLGRIEQILTVLKKSE